MNRLLILGCLCLSLSLNIYLISGYSSGLLPTCDLGTDQKYGTGSLMNWAKPPTASTLFSIRSGDGLNRVDDPTSYTSGTPIPIHVRTLSPNTRYLGIVLYAIKGTNTALKSDIDYQIGQWTVSPDTGFQIISPGDRKGTCITHQTAELKTLHNIFWFEAPKGTGDITFKILLKIGEQNTGRFVYPATYLTLREDFPAQKPNPTTESKVGEPCSEACARSYPATAKYCDANATLALTTSSTLDTQFVTTTCRLPYISTCSSAAPMQLGGEGGFCSLNAPDCDVPVKSDCLIADPSASRFCYCTSDVTKSGAVNQDPGNTTPPGPSTGSTLPISETLLIIIVVVAVGGAFVAFGVYGYWKKHRFTKNSAYLASETNDTPSPEIQVEQQYQPRSGGRLHIPMPSGRV